MSKSNYSSQSSTSRSYYPSSRSESSTSRIVKSHRSNQSNEEYPTFHIHSSDYDLIFVNNNTSTNTMNNLLNHVNVCKQYSIDTESERNNNQLSLIQINSIPIESPSLVILFELKHLPDRNSQKYENIHQLFRLIFRLGNEIYSWGNMEKELEPIKEFFIWPIPAKLVDIQPHFPAWYTWARTQCRVQGLLHRNDVYNDNEVIQQHHQQLSCHCHPSSPYKINELWSLQNAFKYGCNLFIDKSCQRSHWSLSLSSSHTLLSHVDRMNMIHYATHDVMAVTFLIRPITEKWTFEKIKNRTMNEIFVAFNSIKLPPIPTSNKNKKIKNINVQKLATLFNYNDSDVEEISSDDEIYVNQLIEPKSNDKINLGPSITITTNECQENVEIPNDKKELNVNLPINDIDLIINDDSKLDINDDEAIKSIEDHEQKCPTRNNKTTNQRRSQEAKKRRNQRRNNTHRMRRYQHHISRPIYYKFKKNIPLAKIILKQHRFKYVHVKIVDDSIIIGVKDETIKEKYQNQMPQDMFDKENYQIHKYHQYHH